MRLLCIVRVTNCIAGFSLDFLLLCNSLTSVQTLVEEIFNLVSKVIWYSSSFASLYRRGHLLVGSVTRFCFKVLISYICGIHLRFDFYGSKWKQKHRNPEIVLTFLDKFSNFARDGEWGEWRHSVIFKASMDSWR